MSDLFIAPNPTTGKDVTDIALYDEVGRRIELRSALNDSDIISLNLSSYANGVYTIILYSERQTYRAKIIKK
jgi:hypothetical protein